VAGLWELESRIGTQAFGEFPRIDVVPAKIAAQLQLADEALIAELKSGKFDKGLTRGSFREDAERFRRDSTKRAFDVRLVDADRFHFEQYVDPPYPNLAMQARVKGTVELLLHVNPQNGSVESVDLISGHPLLVPIATDSARQWRLVRGGEAAVRVAIEFLMDCP